MADEEPEAVTNGPAGDAGDDHAENAQPVRRPCVESGANQARLAWQGHAQRLEADQCEDGKVTVLTNDGRQGPASRLMGVSC